MNPPSSPESRRVCGARKRNGQRCQGPPMANGRCRLHGGATPVGVAAARFRHGRYSKVLPAELGVQYATARADPELLALHDEIALVDTRTATLLDPQATPPAVLWARLQAGVQRFEQAQAAGQVAAVRR